MDFNCCIFTDYFETVEDVTYIHVDCFADINDKIKHCRTISVLERMTKNIQKKELIIHPCVTTEKGFWLYLERLLKDTKSMKINIKVLITEGLPKLFENRCKVIKKEIVEDVVDNNITTKWKINKYRDKKSNDSYIMAFVKKI